jgi:hypothetical protein
VNGSLRTIPGFVPAQANAAGVASQLALSNSFNPFFNRYNPWFYGLYGNPYWYGGLYGYPYGYGLYGYGGYGSPYFNTYGYGGYGPGYGGADAYAAGDGYGYANPYIASSNATNPYAANPYATNPYAANPYAASPYVASANVAPSGQSSGFGNAAAGAGTLLAAAGLPMSDGKLEWPLALRVLPGAEADRKRIEGLYQTAADQAAKGSLNPGLPLQIYRAVEKLEKLLARDKAERLTFSSTMYTQCEQFLRRLKQAAQTVAAASPPSASVPAAPGNPPQAR